MTVSLATITALRELFSTGESRTAAMAALGDPMRYGLWGRDQAKTRWVARSALVRLAALVPSADEAVAAVFACVAEVRQQWFPLVAARLREAGRRRDVAALCLAIERLGPAAERLRALLPIATLKPTGFGELEQALFGASAEQAVAAPKILRAIAATAELVEGGRAPEAPPLADVDPLTPAQNWCPGRLLQLPDVDRPPPGGPTAVLNGSCALFAPDEQTSGESLAHARMRWALARPWATLLAQIVFTQEAWRAEQITGGLALELGEDQLAHPYEPTRVDLVVTTPSGEEVLCGTLADFIQRILKRLDVTLLARPEEAAELDERLAPVVRRLVEQQVWRYDAGAGFGRRSGFVIGEEFSTSCYRAFGSKYFYRLASPLTAAVRQTAELWARERLNVATSGTAVSG